jgi:flagellin
LQRIRELAVQAQNGTNSASDIDSIQSEVNQRLHEINRVAQQTQFNGIKILAGNSATTISIQVGANDGENIGITINANSDWNKLGALAVGNDTASQAFATATGTVFTATETSSSMGTAGTSVAYTANRSGTSSTTVNLSNVGWILVLLTCCRVVLMSCLPVS